MLILNYNTGNQTIWENLIQKIIEHPQQYTIKLKINGKYNHGFNVISTASWKNPNLNLSTRFILNLSHKNFKNKNYTTKQIQIKLNLNYDISAIATALASFAAALIKTKKIDCALNNNLDNEDWVSFLYFFFFAFRELFL